MKSGQLSEFYDYLFRRVEHFDQDIIEDIRPASLWIVDIPHPKPQSNWWKCREEVRKMAEGIAYDARVI